MAVTEKILCMSFGFVGELVWYGKNLWHNLSGFKGGSFGDLFSWMHDQRRMDEFQFFILICWSLWIDRNMLVFQGIMKSVSDTIARYRELILSYSP